MRYPRAFLFLALLSILIAPGCIRGPIFVPTAQRHTIDRAIVDYPGGMLLEEVVKNLNSPIDCEADSAGNLIVVESGTTGSDPRIYGFHPDGTLFTIYPPPRPIAVPFDLIKYGFRIYGPVGGITIDNGKIYVSHRDADGFGMITAFNYDGSHTAIISNLPCRGDHGMSDLAMSSSGRLWFGVGSATNSGVVGLDNWDWVKNRPEVCDRSFVDLKLNGYHFKSKNPDAGIFGQPEIAVTAPFQPFNVSSQTRIRHQEFPTAAIYSVNAAGGSVRVEAHGVRCPRGLTYSPLGTLYMTNDGMELRGTRPIKDDPDALLVVRSGWYGFPDFSTDLRPLTDERFQLRGDMLSLLIPSGYDEISFLLDHNASNNGEGLIAPVGSLLQATFPPLSGAGLFDFVPEEGPLAEFRGNVIVPLSGDRAPYATSGRKLVEHIGFKVVRVDLTSREVFDFIRNSKGKPASLLPEGKGLLERPVAAKFAPDGSLYIVDMGQMDVKDGRVKTKPNTGRVLRLRAMPATQPATTRKSTPLMD